MSEPKTIDLKDATIYLVDGASPTPNQLEIHLDEGNLTWSEKRNIEYKLDRGILDHVREGDQVPMEISIEARFDKLTSYGSSETWSLSEFLKGLANGAGDTPVSVGGACQLFACDIVVELNRACTSGVSNADEVYTFAEFRYEDIGGDFKAGTLSVSGKCNSVAPSSVRTTLT